jgi:pilus assembly protein CpaB
MSGRRIAILGLALGSAGMAAYLAMGLVGKKPNKETVEISTVATVPVLVASKDMQMGEKMVAGTIGWQDWPVKQVTQPMITRDEEPDALQTYGEARARLAIFEGEPVMPRKAVLPNDRGFMSAILPKGYRGISVEISAATGAGGFILPNDRVDVILTRKAEDDSSGMKVAVSETVISNVRVLAIDQTYKQKPEDEQVLKPDKTALLELDPRQTEIIAKAENEGTLSLALRSIAEGGDKGMGDTVPVLSEKYAGGEKGSGDQFVTIKYGIEKTYVNR